MTKLKGGYTLVSLMFVDLALGGIIAGLGERLHSIGSKRVVLTDIVVSGEAKKEIPVQVDLELDYTEPEDDSEPEPIYKATIRGVYGYTLSITDGTLTSEAEKDALQLEEEIGELQTVVGDSDSGLVKDVSDLQTTVAGKTDLVSVQSLIEGGTVSNAKPVYCHPISIDGTSTGHSEIHVSLLIFDNVNTQYNTADKLATKLNGIFSVAPDAVFPITGGLYYIPNTAVHIAQKIIRDNGDNIIKTVRPDGTQGNFNLALYSDQDVTIVDGVNKIN